MINVFYCVKKGYLIFLEIWVYYKNRDIYYLYVIVVLIFLKEKIFGVYLMIKDIMESK